MKFRFDGKTISGIVVPDHSFDLDTIYSVALLETLASFRKPEYVDALYIAQHPADYPIPIIRVSETSPDYLRALDDVGYLRINIGEGEMNNTEARESDESAEVRTTLFTLWTKIMANDKHILSNDEKTFTNVMHCNLICRLDKAILLNESIALTDLVYNAQYGIESEGTRFSIAVKTAADPIYKYLAQVMFDAREYRRCIQLCDAFQTTAMLNENHFVISPYEFPTHIIAEAYPQAIGYIYPHFETNEPKYREPDCWIIKGLTAQIPGKPRYPRWVFPKGTASGKDFLMYHPDVIVSDDGSEMRVRSRAQLQLLFGESAIPMFKQATTYGVNAIDDASMTRTFPQNCGLNGDEIEKLPTYQRLRYGAAVDLVSDIKSILQPIESVCYGDEEHRPRFMEDPD